jgi:hypothetical protein|tara:strand:+ start:461 stop:613 length:153 start_codon:yes stop_codon:yes gene_type:complete
MFRIQLAKTRRVFTNRPKVSSFEMKIAFSGAIGNITSDYPSNRTVVNWQI